MRDNLPDKPSLSNVVHTRQAVHSHSISQRRRRLGLAALILPVLFAALTACGGDRGSIESGGVGSTPSVDSTPSNGNPGNGNPTAPSIANTEPLTISLTTDGAPLFQRPRENRRIAAPYTCSKKTRVTAGFRSPNYPTHNLSALPA